MVESQLDELECMKRCDPNALLTELTHNQQKIKTDDNLYYDEVQDESQKVHYYRNFPTNNTNPYDLFQAYHKLMVRTHQFMHPYYISKDQFLYKWVDLRPNGQLKGIYSEAHQDPETLIKEDLEAVQKQFEGYQALMKIHHSSDEDLLDQIKSISRLHKLNTEHVVPQSWYQAKEPMKGDLHHLFVCEPKCNSMRSNFPYYEFAYGQLPLPFQNSCGKYELNRFEPSYGRGIAARATLYFLLRYPEKITRKFTSHVNISLLKRWHKRYPVTIYEKHRNKAIFEIQGNRNPFIDFPELPKKLDFTVMKHTKDNNA